MSDAANPSHEPVEVIERAVLRLLPRPLQAFLLRHHEIIKFAVVGATTMVFDMAVYYALIFTVMPTKPTVAKIFSGVLATVLSYILNSEWSFKHRGGRQRHHEALLFFGISGIGALLGAAPLWVANNLFHIRHGGSWLHTVLIDFVLAYIIGNFLQMVFRFWALRKFAYPALLDELPPENEDATALAP
ncbi:MAG: GtrA family protein [Segniliparus sp.]|uniref:GtrA family protein n=1 Tax=Segniliparus sp. TaxID=2804064 RepID=UPI003F2C4570